jgi:hypothetical protein
VHSPCLNHATCFSSAVVRPWGRGCAGLSSRELKHPASGRGADWWANVPLSAKVMQISDGSVPFVSLGLPHVISCMVYERPPLRLFRTV